MRKKTVLIAFITFIGALLLYSCGETHNSKNSLDWAGTYRGVMPCADCNGIATLIVLNQDNTYQLKSKYLGKSGETTEKSAKFEWRRDGNTININPEDQSSEGASLYKIEENRIVALDSDGKVITGEHADMYILTKVFSNLVDKTWILTELNGNPIVVSEGTRNPQIMFDLLEGRFWGNGSCNNMFGVFKEGENGKLSLSGVASTMMACMNMGLESEYFKALEKIAEYSISNNILTVSDAEGNILAKFKQSL